MKIDFKSKNVKRTTIAVAICAMLLLTLSFYSQGIGGSLDTEKIEAVYGKAIFGGGFSWLGNVKRPGLSTSVNDGGLLAFDFKSPQPLLANRFINPTQGLEYITAPQGGLRPLGITDNHSPFNDEAKLPTLTIPARGQPNFSLRFGGSGSSSGGDIPPPVVPAPGAISLALMGIAAVLSARKKKLQ